MTPGRIWAEIAASGLDAERKRVFQESFRRLARWLNKWPYRWNMYRIGPKTKEYFDNGGKAVVYGLGEVKVVEAVGDTRIVRRRVRSSSEEPAIEDDQGEADLTIELE